MLLIEPVSACNLRCPFCFKQINLLQRNLLWVLLILIFLKKLLIKLMNWKLGAITIASRGEPTMHKSYIQMLEYINQKENIFEIKTNTNGTYLTEEMCHAIFKNNLTQYSYFFRSLY